MPASSKRMEVFASSANLPANTEPAAPPPTMITSYFMVSSSLVCLLDCDTTLGLKFGQLKEWFIMGREFSSAKDTKDVLDYVS